MLVCGPSRCSSTLKRQITGELIPDSTEVCKFQLENNKIFSFSLKRNCFVVPVDACSFTFKMQKLCFSLRCGSFGLGFEFKKGIVVMVPVE